MNDFDANLSKNRALKTMRWNHFFKTYEDTSDENVAEFSLSLFNSVETPVTSSAEELTLAVASADPPSKECENEETPDQKLIDLIENKLQSNLKHLIFQREKSKLLMDYKNYPAIHRNVLKELCRISDDVSKDQMTQYFKLILTPNEVKKGVIENILKSPLKKLILQQFKLAKETHRHIKCSKKLLKEWNALKEVFSEEDVIIYAVQASKEQL